MRTIIISIIISFWAIGIQAQVTIQPRVFASMGSFTSSGNISISTTMGESLIQTKSFSGDLAVTQGFQQPNLMMASGIDDLADAPFHLNVFPNPVGEVLSVELSGIVTQPIRLQLFDAQGRAIDKWSFELAHTGLIQRSMEHLASGMYVLKVSQTDGKYAGALTILRR
ncbi:MAG: T9SS type A sorting domain-containing protein [Bacteroidota bacterium]